jgi:hypothetical protein
VAGSPFGPWDVGGPLPKPGPLTGTALAEFAPLYHLFAQRGISKEQVDEYEVWETAAAFGLHRSPEEIEQERLEHEAARSPIGRSRGHRPTASNLALLRQRLAASRGLAPPPVARPSPTEGILRARLRG